VSRVARPRDASAADGPPPARDSGGAADELLNAVRAGGLLSPERPVIVMLSGGRDSTCLLDVAVRIAGPASVTALHVNYGLRGDAEDDERHCRELCTRLGVAIDVRRTGPAGAGNLHAWAREQRYAAALALAGAEADIAAGHTATDQVETILYRLASSPSRRALLGMAGRDGQLVRPLLDYTREETAAYCRARGLSWREDASNDAPRFARARVRHGLVPALREVHPAAEHNVLALAAVLRDEAAVLDALVDETLGGAATIELSRLRALPLALGRLIVQRLADECAGRPAAGVARRTGELLALRRHGTAKLDVGAGLRAVCQRGVLRFERLDGAPPYTP
jgi:tRNA(Ile)-lysidine synthase